MTLLLLLALPVLAARQMAAPPRLAPPVVPMAQPAPAPGRVHLEQALQETGAAVQLQLEPAAKGDAGESHQAGQALQDAVAGEKTVSAPAVEANEPPAGTPPSRLRRIAGATPWATMGLVAANTALYQNQILTAFDPAKPSLLSAVHSIFSHADPNHIGHNMVMLLIFGSSLELFTKRRTAMLAVYLAAGLFPLAARAAGVMTPVASVGASAAIYGIAGAFLASLFRAPRSGWDFLGYMVGAIAFDLFMKNLFVTLAGTAPGIDTIAHMVSFGAGAAMGWKWLRGPSPTKG